MPLLRKHFFGARLPTVLHHHLREARKGTNGTNDIKEQSIQIMTITLERGSNIIRCSIAAAKGDCRERGNKEKVIAEEKEATITIKRRRNKTAPPATTMVLRSRNKNK